MFNFSFTAKSGNEKTGPIAVTRTDKRSCPDSCPLKGAGCYAEGGPVMIHWKKLDTAGLSLKQLCDSIKTIVDGALWRHNESGDLPGYNDKIDTKQLNMIVDANKGKRGFTYTHYPLVQHNIKAIVNAVKKGFTINASLNNLFEISSVKHLNIPKVVILPDNAPIKFEYDGVPVMACPAQIKDGITCHKCGLCQKPDRKMIIGFYPHGFRKNKVKAISYQPL